MREVIRVLVSVSLSGLRLFSGHQHWPPQHTLDNGHQAPSVYQLCAAFLLKEVVPGLKLTHICAELDFNN